MTNFAKKLEAQFIQRRNMARRANTVDTLPADTAAFEAFIETRCKVVLDMCLQARANPNLRTIPDHMPIICDTCGDNYPSFDNLPQWQAFLRQAANAGARVHKARHITPMTDEELSQPENMGFGRIGGRPSGVVVTLYFEETLRDVELQVLSCLPSLAEVKADFAREVEARDPSSFGNCFSVEYPLQQACKPELVYATNAWRLFAAACGELGLQVQLAREYGTRREEGANLNRILVEAIFQV